MAAAAEAAEFRLTVAAATTWGSLMFTCVVSESNFSPKAFDRGVDLAASAYFAYSTAAKVAFVCNLLLCKHTAIPRKYLCQIFSEVKLDAAYTTSLWSDFYEGFQTRAQFKDVALLSAEY